MRDLEEKLVKFIQEQVQQAGFQKVILGLSGGIDSALVAYLAVKALGKENVLTVKMPYKTSSKESIEHANLVLRDLGLQEKTIEITPMVDAYFSMQAEATSLRRGNYMARTRMAIYFISPLWKMLLLLGLPIRQKFYWDMELYLEIWPVLSIQLEIFIKKMFGNCHDIWEFLKKLLTSSRVQIYGKGKQTRKNWD